MNHSHQSSSVALSFHHSLSTVTPKTTRQIDIPLTKTMKFLVLLTVLMLCMFTFTRKCQIKFLCASNSIAPLFRSVQCQHSSFCRRHRETDAIYLLPKCGLSRCRKVCAGKGEVFLRCLPHPEDTGIDKCDCLMP
jgi:hypothetical protein